MKTREPLAKTLMRALSFEIEQGFEGPVGELLGGASAKTTDTGGNFPN